MNKYLTVFLLAFIMTAVSAGSGKKRFSFTGIDNCKTCHSSEGGLTQYERWLSSPHAKAFRELKTKKAQKIAARIGVEKPWDDNRCLRCHTTGRGKNKKTRSEGVGCEACHGPGSSYYRVEGHVDFRDRRRGYLVARKNGMYPILDYEDNLIKREKLCRFCHNKKRPCMPGKKEEIQRQILTIQVIDTLKKGDLDFSHPLRKY